MKPPYPGAGDACVSSKLTAAAVLEIRARSDAGETTRGLGRAFGVSHQAISDIRTGRTWKTV